MDEIMKEQEEKKDVTINPLDYVTIPVKEYKKLIRQTAKKALAKKHKKELADIESTKQQYYRWWREEEKKAKELRANLDDAKAMIAEKLGVNPEEFLAEKADAETEKLADLQFEKGVANETII